MQKKIAKLLFFFLLIIYHQTIVAFSTIQIQTRFSSFAGSPTWLIIIRDLDSGESHPYLFDIEQGENFWTIPIPSHYYLITVSNLKIHRYDPHLNQYRRYEIKNFCNLESRGRIIRGKSLYLTIDGRLSKNSNGYRCNLQKW